jgi:hypothetical protein
MRKKIRFCGTIFKTIEMQQSIKCIGVDSKKDKGSLAFKEYEEDGEKMLEDSQKNCRSYQI